MNEENKPTATAEKSKEAINITIKQDEPRKNTIEELVKIIGIIVTVATLVYTGCQYSAGEKWKVAEFTSQKFKEFSENESVKLANLMLDYNVRPIDIFLNDSPITIRDSLIDSALVTHNIRGNFSTVEYRIRDIFDEYFDQLSLFNRYVKTKLIKDEQVRLYIDYYIQIFAKPNKNRKGEKLLKTMSEYIVFYEFKDVSELCRRYGYDFKK